MVKKPTAKSKPALNARQELFINIYMVNGFNAADAYKKAGYKGQGNQAEANASRLISNDKVAAAIAQRRAKLAKPYELTQERLVRELARIVYFDVRKLYNDDGSLKAVHELDADTAAAISSVEVVEMAGSAAVGGEEGLAHVPMYTKKVRISDKNTAVRNAMQYLGLLVEKKEIRTGPLDATSDEDLDALIEHQRQELADATGASKSLH